MPEGLRDLCDLLQPVRERLRRARDTPQPLHDGVPRICDIRPSLREGVLRAHDTRPPLHEPLPIPHVTHPCQNGTAAASMVRRAIWMDKFLYQNFAVPI